MLTDILNNLSNLVAALPDGEATLPDGMDDSLGTVVGWAKALGYTVLVFVLIAAAVSLANASRGRGDSTEAGASFLKIVLAAVVIGSAVTIVEVFVA